MMGRPQQVEERFWTFVDKSGECWLWTGTKNRGYGQFSPQHKRTVKAHRFAYELIVGPIPDGLQIDHLCRVPSCVNPAHLEPVTSRENTMRGNNFAAVNARKTHCPAGHPYDEGNTYWNAGERACRACQSEHSRRAYAKKLQARTLTGSASRAATTEEGG